MAKQKLSQSVPVMFIFAGLVVVGAAYLLMTQVSSISVPRISWEPVPTQKADVAAVETMAEVEPAEAEAIPEVAVETAPEAAIADESASGDTLAETAGELVDDMSAVTEDTADKVAETTGSAADAVVSLSSDLTGSADAGADIAADDSMATPEANIVAAEQEPVIADSEEPAIEAEAAAPAATDDEAMTASEEPAAMEEVTVATSETAMAEPATSEAVKEPKAEVAALEHSQASASTLNIKDAKWLLSQDPSTFAVQLLATKGEDGISQFMTKHPELPTPQLAYFNRKSGGEDWAVLLVGVYPTLEAAVAAVNSLPSDVKAKNPWVRKLAAVQKDIQ